MRTQYGVWKKWDPETESGNYWEMYDTLELAVAELGEDREIYRLDPTLMGKYTLKTVLIRKKKQKAKRTKKA